MPRAAFDPDALAQPRLGRLVRCARGGARLSLRDLAREAGVPLTTVARVEAGRDALLSSVHPLLVWLSERS